MSVVTATLSEVADINPRVDRGEFSDLAEVVTFVPMAQVSEVSGAITSEDHRPVGELLKGFTPFVDRDVLVAKITPCFENGKIAHARISKRAGFGSTEFHVIRANTERLDDRYLFHFLRQPLIRVRGEKRMTGSGGQRRVPKAFLQSLDIPLPPLAEQRRIAAILDKADALRAKRREAIAKLDQLLQSVFLDMFGDPVACSEGATKQPLVELSELMVRGKRSLNPAKFPDEEFELHSIPAFDAGAPELLRGEDIGSAKQLVQSGDVMISKIVPHIRRSAIVGDSSHRRQIASGEWIVFRSDRVMPAYLQRLLLMDGFHARFMSTVSGVGGSLLRARPAEVAKIRVVVPELSKQREFARLASSVEDSRHEMHTSLRQLTFLFSSLQHRAFSGAL